jgi:hypothetical protein
MPENNTVDDTFGFGAARRGSGGTADKIRKIKPSLPPDVHADMDAVDAAGHNVGFVSREASTTAPPAAPAPPLAAPEVEYRPERTQGAEPRIPLNMRIPTSAGRAFQRFCTENRYSYPEALIEIMRRAGIPTK